MTILLQYLQHHVKLGFYFQTFFFMKLFSNIKKNFQKVLKKKFPPPLFN